ncbi:TPA: T3SS effector NleG family protein, partial [Escherichia coli]
MPLITSSLSSNVALQSIEILREAARQNLITKAITINGQKVGIHYYHRPDVFLVSGCKDGMLKTLLELGLNGSNESAKRLRSWQISSVIDTHLSFLPLGICYKILSSSFPVHSEEVFFPEEHLKCPIILDAPDNGVFIKNSVSAKVCNLYDKNAMLKLVI